MRSMAKWAADWLRSSGEPCVMVTLTFDGGPEEWGGAECKAAFNRFMVRFKRVFWCRDYVVARELQERGVYHYHVVVLGVRYLPVDELSSMWGVGFVWVTAYDQPGRAVAYALKYAGKGGRLHASYHLLDGLGVRSAVEGWRLWVRGVLRLGDGLRSGRLELDEYRGALVEWAGVNGWRFS